MQTCGPENEPVAYIYTSCMLQCFFQTFFPFIIVYEQGAMGIGGPVSVVYPVESPGGYQLYGRALPTWQTWGKGKDFAPERPWILLPFDQVLSNKFFF